MKKLSAKDALDITTKTEAYLDSLLSDIFGEVRKQASQGLRWAHVNVDHKCSDSFLSKLKDVLILEGYKMESPKIGQHQFRIEW